MKHLDHSAALALAEGAGDEVGQRHAAACDRCQALVAECRRLLDALAAVRAEPQPPQRLLRWARAFASSATAAEPRWRVLRFLTEGATMVAATRAGARTGTAMLYGDDRHQMDVRIEPAGSGRSRLHGQVVPLGDGDPQVWQITAVGPEGETLSTTSDALGEFWLDEIGSWEGASVVARSGSECVVVARLGTAPEAGDGDDPA